MANNEPGNGRDPWKRDDDQPNDLDQIARYWQKRFEGILGGGGSGGRGGSGGAGGIALIVLLLVAWMLSGLYRVDEAERGVVQRFGKHMPVSSTQPVTMPGLRWHWPYPIETVNIEEVNDFNFSKEMLTADEWYVFIDIAVQYRRTDPVKYSFEVADPDQTLNDVTESALRGVVGTSTLASLIGERREEIPARTMVELQETLLAYGAGLTVTSININSSCRMPRRTVNRSSQVRKVTRRVSKHCLPNIARRPGLLVIDCISMPLKRFTAVRQKSLSTLMAVGISCTCLLISS